MKRKGLSQVLALIVAAAVLMMTALTVIFMVQGGLGDLGSNTGAQSCTGTVDAICQSSNSVEDTPSVCLNDNDELIPGVDSDQVGGGQASGPTEMDCSIS